MKEKTVNLIDCGKFKIAEITLEKSNMTEFKYLLQQFDFRQTEHCETGQ